MTPHIWDLQACMLTIMSHSATEAGPLPTYTQIGETLSRASSMHKDLIWTKFWFVTKISFCSCVAKTCVQKSY
jgi:hypothetical protein